MFLVSRRPRRWKRSLPVPDPADLLPGAETLICLGLPVPRGIFKSGEKALRLYWRTANIYYRQIDALLLQAAGLLEETGETAVPVFG